MGRIFTRGAGALATGAVLALSLQAIPAQAGTTTAMTGTTAATAAGWRLTSVFGTGAANIDAASPAGITAPGPGSAWSLWNGCTWPCDSTPPPPVVRHWNGRRWAAIPAAALHGLRATAVTASSARDAWLLGSFPDAKAPGGTIDGALHWNGTTWSKRAVPDWLIKINGSGDVDLYPADFGRSGTWVFSLGGYIGEKAAFAGRYHHGRWTKFRLPGVPDSAAALSVNNVWVLGQELTHPSRFVLMHWNGKRWSTTSVPRQSVAGNAGSLVATGPRDLWMSWFPTKTGAQQYLLHWAGGRWSKVRLPGGDSGSPSVSDGAGGFWGDGFAAGKKRVQLFLHWHAGRWTTTRVPNGTHEPGNVDELALIGGTRSVWATGNVFGPGDGTTLNRGTIWRYTP
jgi:hypothetical protein